MSAAKSDDRPGATTMPNDFDALLKDRQPMFPKFRQHVDLVREAGEIVRRAAAQPEGSPDSLAAGVISRLLAEVRGERNDLRAR
jgi:hypothetical protein